jgi:hypothetical protein
MAPHPNRIANPVKGKSVIDSGAVKRDNFDQTVLELRY